MLFKKKPLCQLCVAIYQIRMQNVSSCISQSFESHRTKQIFSKLLSSQEFSNQRQYYLVNFETKKTLGSKPCSELSVENIWCTLAFKCQLPQLSLKILLGDLGVWVQGKGRDHFPSCPFALLLSNICLLRLLLFKDRTILDRFCPNFLAYLSSLWQYHDSPI